MDIKQLLPMLAQMEPGPRAQFAAAVGLPAAALSRIEELAEGMGIELMGGRSTLESVGEGAEGDEDDGGGGGGAGADADDGDDARPNLAQVLEAARAKFWSLAGGALFFGAVPIVLYIMRKRRGLSWGELASTIVRLPFSD